MHVSAGDLEKYSYCPLSWWLSKAHKIVTQDGVDHHRNVENDLIGIQAHEQHVHFYERYTLFFAIASSLIAIAGIALIYNSGYFWTYFFLVIALIWLLNSIFFLYRASKTEPVLQAQYEKMLLLSAIGAIVVAFFVLLLNAPENSHLALFFEILSIVWVALANIIFYRSLGISDRLLLEKTKYTSPQGEIEYVGASRKGHELISELYGIRGKPDYIIRLNDDHIPVEEKSSNLLSPHFPHVIQITAYCMIVEDVYGTRPPYGIIRYRHEEFKIPYEKRWKQTVISLREKLLNDKKKNEAHRNHSNPRKCEYCSLRKICSEALI